MNEPRFPVWPAYRPCRTCKAKSGMACTTPEPYEKRELRSVAFTGSRPQNPRLAAAYFKEVARLSDQGVGD